MDTLIVCTAESKFKLWGCTSIGFVGPLEFDYIEPRVNTVRRNPEPAFQTRCAARREFPFWSLWFASQPGTRTHNSPRLPRRPLRWLKARLPQRMVVELEPAKGSSATEAIGRPIRLLTKRYTWISKRKRYCQSTPILTKRMN